MMIHTENGIFNYKVFKGFTNCMYSFAIEEKQLLPLRNVPMFQSSFLFSIILPIRKSEVKMSHSLVMKKNL